MRKLARNEPNESKPVPRPALVRDKGFLTRILILSHIRSSPRATLREVGAELGITMQAVSTYMKRLDREGVIEPHPSGGRRLTPLGLQWLQDALLATRAVVEEALEPMTVIETTSAVAGEHIPRGARVSLTMEAGVLTARAGVHSPSQGRASNEARRGEEVLVADLEGMVELPPGRIVLVRLPRPEEGGSTRVDAAKLQALLRDHWTRDAKLGIVGLGGRVLASRLGATVDFAFGATHGAFHAAELGLNSVLLVTGDLFRECVTALEQLNSQSPQHVVIDVVQAPLSPDEAPSPRFARAIRETRVGL